MGPRCPERLASSLGHTASCGGGRIITQNTQAHHHEPHQGFSAEVSMCSRVSWVGIQQEHYAVVAYYAFYHFQQNANHKCNNRSIKRQQRKNKERKKKKSPGVVESFGLLLFPFPSRPTPFAKATVPKWGTSATRWTPCAYMGLDVRGKKHPAVAQRLPWRRSRGPPAMWGSARRAPRVCRSCRAPCRRAPGASRAANSASDTVRRGRGGARPRRR